MNNANNVLPFKPRTRAAAEPTEVWIIDVAGFRLSENDNEGLHLGHATAIELGHRYFIWAATPLGLGATKTAPSLKAVVRMVKTTLPKVLAGINVGTRMVYRYILSPSATAYMQRCLE